MIEIVESDCVKQGHAEFIVKLMDEYARGIIGGGDSLSEQVKANLAQELAKRNNIYTVIAIVDNEPAGIAISIEGFSTFSCKPLLNIHDVFVKPEFRGRGLSRMLLEKVEEIAVRLGCCKMTLEVLEHNDVAKNLYRSFGFKPYQQDPTLGCALFYEKSL
jgi:ribosomal protein S18 acetylase RimI-like enzyme